MWLRLFGGGAAPVFQRQQTEQSQFFQHVMEDQTRLFNDIEQSHQWFQQLVAFCEPVAAYVNLNSFDLCQVYGNTLKTHAGN